MEPKISFYLILSFHWPRQYLKNHTTFDINRYDRQSKLSDPMRQKGTAAYLHFSMKEGEKAQYKCSVIR